MNAMTRPHSRKEQVLEAMRNSDESLTPTEIHERTDIPVGTVRHVVRDLLEHGDLVQPAYGYYDLPSRVPEEEQYHAPSDNGEGATSRDGLESTQLVEVGIVTASAGDGAEPERIRRTLVTAEKFKRDFRKAPPVSGKSDAWYVRVEGDSMSPEFSDGQQLPIDRFEGNLDEIRSNGLYVVLYQETLHIRRVDVNSDGSVRLIATNPWYGEQLIKGDHRQDVQVLARVRLSERQQMIGAFMRNILKK
jgi:phage repressor protein C with HTH and peptisase S24 domain